MKTKAWEWEKVEKKSWHDPSQESFYLLNRWKEKEFSRFLDLGCGRGRHAILFAQNGFRVHALDFSESVIEELQQNALEKQVQLYAEHGSMIELPFEDNSFDCLLAFHVISHTDSIGIRKVISEINRVLVPGGEFYLTLCSKITWSYTAARFPKIDENTVMKVEDGPENGIPHYFADKAAIDELFKDTTIHSLRHIQDLVVNKKSSDSWHYFILGSNEPPVEDTK